MLLSVTGIRSAGQGRPAEAVEAPEIVVEAAIVEEAPVKVDSVAEEAQVEVEAVVSSELLEAEAIVEETPTEKKPKKAPAKKTKAEIAISIVSISESKDSTN